MYKVGLVVSLIQPGQGQPSILPTCMAQVPSPKRGHLLIVDVWESKGVYPLLVPFLWLSAVIVLFGLLVSLGLLHR